MVKFTEISCKSAEYVNKKGESTSTKTNNNKGEPITKEFEKPTKLSEPLSYSEVMDTLKELLPTINMDLEESRQESVSKFYEAIMNNLIIFVVIICIVGGIGLSVYFLRKMKLERIWGK